jgi:hypothetical protein
LHHLADCRCVRRFLEVVFSARCRRRLARLDQTTAERAQLRTLLGLVHEARATPFGRDHDFARIRSAADFRRLVPLRSPAELWRTYGAARAAWPGPPPFRATPHPVLGEHLRPVGLSRGLLQAQRHALFMALAFVLHARPNARLLAGPLFWLGDDTLLSTPAGEAASSAALAGERFPRLLRPGVRAGLTWDCPEREDVDAVVPLLARRLERESPTCLVGPAERIASLLEQCEARPGGRLWPALAAVLYTRRDRSFDVRRLSGRLAPSVVLLEVVSRPEGPVAVEDPRCGALRLLAESGLYYELVRPGRAGALHPDRLGFADARLGEPYELAVTSPAGVWACRTGMRVCLDALSPPLLRVLPAPAPAPAAVPAAGPVVRCDAGRALPGPVSHRQTAGSPAGLPERSAHSPSTALADRG